jgi:hypothetical protein
LNPSPRTKFWSQPPNQKHEATKSPSAKSKPFEAYWSKFVGDDSVHDLADIDSFFDGFDIEDELMHSKCQMFRMRQIQKTIQEDQYQYEYAIYSKIVEGARDIINIEKSIKRDAIKFEHHIMIQGLREVDEIARARKLKADLLIIGAAFEALNNKLRS